MKKEKIAPSKVALHTVLILLSLLFILPFLLIIAVSFTREDTVTLYGYSLYIREFSTSAYAYVFKNFSSVANAYIVTIFYAFVGTLLSVLIMALGGYVLSRREFKYRGIIQIMLLITMFFHGGLMPTYLINTKVFGFQNNLLAYLLSGTVAAYTVFVFKAFFMQIPSSLIEAAKLDGATDMQVFRFIIIPSSTAIIATMSFMGLISRWNNFEISLYYMTNTKYFTLQYLLQLILREAEFLRQAMQLMPESVAAVTLPMETLKFAMCVVAAGPMVILFPFFQKYFSKGMMVGAVKG